MKISLHGTWPRANIATRNLFLQNNFLNPNKIFLLKTIPNVKNDLYNSNMLKITDAITAKNSLFCRDC